MTLGNPFEGLPETIGAALGWAVRELRRSDVDSPRLTGELLLAHVLSWDRVRLLGHIHDPLPPAAWKRFRDLVARRASGEPPQYLTGEKEFYGLTFRVTPAVLIPRPETEILVEKTLSLARNREGSMRLADVGTGSGCIAVTLARELPRALFWATDISPEALLVARQNAARLDTGHRIAFVCSDLLECFPARAAFDFILSNPPYISGPDMGGLPPMVREHEPREALFGGESGIEVYLRLIPQAATRLAEDGWLLLEVGAGEAPEVAALVRREGLIVSEILDDLQKIPRCLVARRGAMDHA